MQVCLVIAATTFLATVDAIQSESFLEKKHPVREEIVDAIKLKATSWKPKEVNENHLRHRTVDSIKNSMGHLGTTPTPFGADMLKGITDSAYGVFKSMTSVMGLKEQAHKLKQSADDQNLDSDLPVNFSWKDKMP